MRRALLGWVFAVPFAALVAGCDGGVETCDPACDTDACEFCDTSGDSPVCVSACGEGASCAGGECVASAPATCDPVCAACQACDTTGASPLCVDLCDTGTVCQNDACVADTSSQCSPACGACEMCDTSGASPVCVGLCSAGTSCDQGACVPDAAPTCEPACGDCQVCDTTGASPLCVDLCDTGTVCELGACVPELEVTCEPVCGDCQMCDTSGAAPICVELCAAGTVCDQGACVPFDACAGACAACQICDTSHGAATCVDSCMPGQFCDDTVQQGVCRPGGDRIPFDHSTLSELDQAFTVDVAGGKAVTAQCLGCHEQAGQEMLDTAHFKWLGDTPGLEGRTTGQTVGKRNLVNNFCVAIPSNEQRCTQCHAGYGWTDDSFDFSDAGNVDCLACHSTTYAKHATTGGGPAATVDMTAAAKAVGRPTRATCGRCHFSAGGGDNVKKGDLGSAMTDPLADADVHMGSDLYQFQCVDCHVASGHKIPGQGVHLPVSEGRLDCVDCHGAAPHAIDVNNEHAVDLACQTCHIPAYSRQQHTKMDWDWSTAGDRTRGTNGVETVEQDGATITVYDAMKGDFIWMKEVRPEYAWFNGKTTRMTLEDSFPAGAGASDSRIHLGGPTATKADADAKIFPFKVMRGRQPVDITNHLVISPKLFGPGGFWPLIPASDAYDAQTVEDNWTSALTLGAVYAGQIASTDVYTGRATGALQWDWAFTDMWMGINHEVAPRTAALSCTDCHYGAAGWDWTALGYACDPAGSDGAEACGSRTP